MFMEVLLKKIFVLDTNVLLFDPTAFRKFGKNTVFIPLIVIEEIDRFKKDQNENGRSARNFSRYIDDLRSRGSLAQGVVLDNGGTLIISVDRHVDSKNLPIDVSINDNLILSSALSFKLEGVDVLLVTKDINLRLKADILGVPAEDYGTLDIALDELYSGQRVFEISGERLKEYEAGRFLALDEEEQFGVFPNEYFILQ